MLSSHVIRIKTYEVIFSIIVIYKTHNSYLYMMSVTTFNGNIRFSRRTSPFRLAPG